ncbi:MAG: AIR synthase-related protein [Candidatus Bathyarchaeota archaeon]|nr:AIR synthase-related protein [Candidatus Bathyarchaeota archaeon]
MSEKLGLGKISKEVFNRSVLPYIPIEKDIELDGAVTTLSGNTVIAHSPSIGVPTEALGFFAFHYSASNVASKFGKPRHLISGIYLPLETTEKELQIIAKTLGDEAKRYKVTITAGQTATYFGVQIPLLTSTCLGEQMKIPDAPRAGDKVCLMGLVGGEALWLDKLSKGESSEVWREFTPLPMILSLQRIEGVKMMHDVSEGGVIGALYEVASSNGWGIKASSKNIPLYPESDNLPGNIFRAPTYGTLIAIIDDDSVDDVVDLCKQVDTSCAIIGEIVSERGLLFDGEDIHEQKRVDIDKIYGTYEKQR